MIFVWVMVVIAILVTVIFWVLTSIWRESESENVKDNREMTDEVVWAILGAQHIVGSGFLVATINLRKTAQVKGADTGHLAITDAVTMLVLQLMMVLSFVLRLFFSDKNFTLKLWATMTMELLAFLLIINFFRVIFKFVSSFRLQTKIGKDGNIDIVGIDPNGKEIFKFVLNKEQQ